VTSAIAVAVGVAVFFLLRRLEVSLQGSIAVNTVLEETVKLAIFAVAAVVSKSKVRENLPFLRGRDNEHALLIPILFPLLCITAFGFTENLLYFASFPTSSIYKRLVYSYPIHLNTALLYALAFLSGKPLRTVSYLLIGAAYHFGLNYLSTRIPDLLIYLIGIGNLIALLHLYWRTRMRILERSMQTCWNQK
jgi:hypothetical protein